MHTIAKHTVVAAIAACGWMAASQAVAVEQRCWTETETRTVQKDRRVLGTVAGAVVGGVVGNQIGSGSGNKIATVGGALGGAAVGNRVGRNRDNNKTETVEVRKCADVTHAPN